MNLSLSGRHFTEDSIEAICYETIVIIDDALLLEDHLVLLCKLNGFLAVALLEIEVLLHHEDLLLLEHAHCLLCLQLEELNLALPCVLFQSNYLDLVGLLNLVDLLAEVLLDPRHFHLRLLLAQLAPHNTIGLKLVHAGQLGSLSVLVFVLSRPELLPIVVFRHNRAVKLGIIAVSAKVVRFGHQAPLDTL